MVGVLMPAMWTFMPTKVWRIPYSSFLAFEFILTAFTLDFVLRHFFRERLAPEVLHNLVDDQLKMGEARRLKLKDELKFSFEMVARRQL